MRKRRSSFMLGSAAYRGMMGDHHTLMVPFRLLLKSMKPLHGSELDAALVESGKVIQRARKFIGNRQKSQVGTWMRADSLQHIRKLILERLRGRAEKFENFCGIPAPHS